jgi:DNA (cytosine-5)-methyltransferase 1
MGFPDDHVFLGPLERQYNMAGESVPPPLARALGEALLRKIGAV